MPPSDDNRQFLWIVLGGVALALVSIILMYFVVQWIGAEVVYGPG